VRTAEDYKRRAGAIAAAFCAGEDVGGNDLATLVEKVARDERLNPEQITRLGRATNSAVFEAKYATMRGQAHRRVDFTIVDPEAVIQKLQLSDGMPAAKLASDRYPELPRPTLPDIAPPTEKIAAVVRLSPRELGARRADAVKLAHDLHTELEVLNLQWQAAVREAAAPCRAMGHDHLAFEKAAVAVLGEDALPELNAVRATIGRPPLAATREKLAEARDRLVAAETPGTRRIKVAMDLRTAYGKVRESLARVEAVRDALTEEMRHG